MAAKATARAQAQVKAQLNRNGFGGSNAAGTTGVRNLTPKQRSLVQKAKSSGGGGAEG